MNILWYAGLMLYLTVFLSPTYTKGEQPDDPLARLTVDALQTLLDEIGEDELDNVKRVLPLYRLDLPENYAAYYEVVHKRNYYIISAGPDTGDYDVNRHGKVPSQIGITRKSAKDHGSSCKTFYVMTPEGDVICSNKDGTFVGASIPDNILLSDFMDSYDTVNISTFDSFVRSEMDELAELWREHTAIVKKQAKKDDEDDPDRDSREIKELLNKKLERRMSVDEQKRSEEAESFEAREIQPGSSVSVATGPVSDIKEARIRYIVTNVNEQSEAGLEDHKKLCAVVRGCDVDSATKQHAVLKPEYVAQRHLLVDIELLSGTEEAFKQYEFIFAFDIVKNDGSVITHHFAVEYSNQGRKRGTYSPWSYWIIGYEYLFPDYDQFQYQGCYVGCGPVAWAMVFGYYDRRSHYKSAYKYSEGLYRSGSDGTTGYTSKIAPSKYSSSDSRLKGYIGRLNDRLGTYCKNGQGSTKRGAMDRVSSFYKARQGGSGVRLYEKNLSLWWRIWDSDRYTDSVKFWVKDRLKSRWPVVVGWKGLKGKMHHLAVATKLAIRYYRYRKCVFFVCWWKKRYYYQMYLHMGWGNPKHNTWTSLNAYYAIYAYYKQ